MSWSNHSSVNIEYVNGEPYLPGMASLVEDLDKRVLVVLQDGRHLVGMLRSFDQYSNLVLENTHERIILPGKYCDVPLGLYVVRGENVVIIGDINHADSTKDLPNFIKITPEQLSQLNELTSPEETNKPEWNFES